MTNIFGPYMSNKVGVHARRSSSSTQRTSPSPQFPFSTGRYGLARTPAVLDATPGNSLKKFTVLRKSIPNIDVVLFNDYINSGQRVLGTEYLYIQKEETQQDRWSKLISIAGRKIEQFNKHNTVKVETPISEGRWLQWFHKFTQKEAEKDIYLPPFTTLSPHNVMGVKWLTGSLPDLLYEDFDIMKTSLQVDLEFCLSKNPLHLQMVQKLSCGYSAFHTKAFIDNMTECAHSLNETSYSTRKILSRQFSRRRKCV